MKRIVVLTSGGDSPGMNAALRAVAKLGAAQGLQVFGSLEGYDGLIDGHFRELTKVLPDGAITVDIEVDAAGGQGGTLIGSARSARFREKDGRVKAADELHPRKDALTAEHALIVDAVLVGERLAAEIVVVVADDLLARLQAKIEEKRHTHPLIGARDVFHPKRQVLQVIEQLDHLGRRRANPPQTGAEG
jgi:hypothetical protein